MPENTLRELLSQDLSWQVMTGAVIKVKDFTLDKAVAIIITLFITGMSLSFTFGYAAHKLDNVLTRIDRFETRLKSVEAIQLDVVEMRSDISNIRETINTYIGKPVRITK
jgi:hypothetical protein